MNIQYPYLPEGRSIQYVPEDNPFMKEAEFARNTLSTDKNHSTGAVVVKDGRIIGKAANQAGFKNPKLIKLHGNGACVRKWLKVKSGTKYWMCPGCSTHEDHAESQAVKNAIKNVGTEAVRGADLYLFGHWWCCKPCWDNMINGGINGVFLLERSWELFDKNNSKNIIGKK